MRRGLDHYVALAQNPLNTTTILGDTMSRSKRQKFLGFTFYCSKKYGAGRYYYMHYRGHYHALHRFVWEYHNGAIPPGHHIHHKDGDPHNNRIENLECMFGPDHARHHTATAPLETHNCVYCGKEYQVKKFARKKGFCSMSCQGGARAKSRVDDVLAPCSVCGKEFMGNKYRHPKQCSPECRKVNLRMCRLKEIEERGVEFMTARFK